MANLTTYTFGVQADTKVAQKSLSDLSKSLRAIQTTNLKMTIDDSEIREASNAASMLQQELTRAMNVKTNTLDLSKLTSNLKAANTDIGTLAKSLLNAGTQGQQAFSQLASAIAKTQAPTKQLSTAFKQMGTTLMNTIKWQASSSLIHGLMSTISGAISYAKNLNSTLNDIRIVTGASDAEMSKFAVTANRMAKELSTTTNDFAKASLIYYQQGDNAELAAKKAAITTKAANVAFTASAREMSEMLTAVWNSYQMGEDQLEHAVDVMAALGATTASSMEEMATAMQKVAATANNVGVSMEQMSAIVATSASVTRQAPQTIGTAWNTILNRLSGLKLGETLEDGVDLNKYSKALATIGVNILDANGDLREMGQIVDEIGARWDSLSKAQQTALAQTIGGVRQYTQINAFFDNFDKYQKNLATAKGADGALQEQADIYAQSWEAASKRVQASMETLYGQLFNDKAITKLTSFFAQLIDGVTKLTDSFGGIGNVISLITTQLISSHIEQFSTKLVEIGHNIKEAFSGNAHIQEYADSISQVQNQMSQALDATDLTASSQIELSYDMQILEVKKQLAAQQGQLTQAQQQHAQTVLANLQQEKEYYTQLADELDKYSKKQAEQKNNMAVENATRRASKQFYGDIYTEEKNNQTRRNYESVVRDDISLAIKGTGSNLEAEKQAAEEVCGKITEMAEKLGIVEDTSKNLTMDQFKDTATAALEQVNQVGGAIDYLKQKTTGADGSELVPDNMKEVLLNALGSADVSGLSGPLQEQIAELQAQIQLLDPNQTNEKWLEWKEQVSSVLQQAQEDVNGNAQDLENNANKSGDILAQLFQTIKTNLNGVNQDANKVVNDAEQQLEKLKNAFTNSLSGASSKIQLFVTTGMALQRVTTSIDQVSKAIDTLSDPDVSGWQKLVTVISTFTTLAMTASSIMRIFQTDIVKTTAAKMGLAGASVTAAGAQAAETASATAGTAANTTLAVSFHAAATAAKSFWASLGPIGWIVLAITAAAAIIGTIAGAINKANQEITKTRQEAMAVIDKNKQQQQELANEYNKLNDILENTNLTLSEQLTKINEITQAMGFQVTALDLLGEGYSGLTMKLNNYMRAKQKKIAQDALEAQQSYEATVSDTAVTNLTAAESVYTVDGPEVSPGVNAYVYLRNKYEGKGLDFDDSTGIISKTPGSSDFKLDDEDRAVLDGVKWWGTRGESGSIEDMVNLYSGFQFEGAGDSLAEKYFGWMTSDMIQTNFSMSEDDFDTAIFDTELFEGRVDPQFQEEFEKWLRKQAADNSAWQSTLDEYEATGRISTSDLAYFANDSDWGKVQFRYNVGHQGSQDEITEIAEGSSNQQDQDVLSLRKNTITQLALSDILSNNDLDYLGVQESGHTIGDFDSLLHSSQNYQGLDMGQLMQMANFFQNFEGYRNEAMQWTSLAAYSSGIASNNTEVSGIENADVKITSALVSYLQQHPEYDVETMLTIRPSAIHFKTEGADLVVDEIDQSALEVAELTVETKKIKAKQQALTDFSGFKGETLTREEISAAKASGYFGEGDNFDEAAFNRFITMGKKERAAWIEEQQTIQQTALDENEGKRKTAIDRELDVIRTEREAAEAKIHENTGSYYDAHGDLQFVSEKSTEDLLSDQAWIDANLTNISTVRQLTGKKWEDLNEDQRTSALNAYNAMHGTDHPELTEDQFTTLFEDGYYGLNRWEERLQSSSDFLRNLLSEFATLSTQEKILEGESSSIADDQEAAEIEKNIIQPISKATKKVELYSAAVGKKNKLDAAQLKQLKELNPELYEKYKDQNITSEQFDEEVYKAHIASLEELKQAYIAAGNTEKAEEIEQEILAQKQAHLTAQIEKSTKAYEAWKAALDKKTKDAAKEKKGVDILTKNVETGELTESDKLTLSKSGVNQDIIEQYNAATDAETRRNLAAQAYSQYLIHENELLIEQNALIDNALQAYEGMWYDNIKSFDSDKMSEFVSTMFRGVNKETQGLIAQTTSELVKAGKITSDMTYKEARTVVLDYLRDTKQLNIDNYEEIKAAGIDAMTSIWKKASEEERKAAEQAVQDWKDAFDRISGYREKIAKGENLADSINSYEDLVAAYQASGYTDVDQFMADLQAGKVTTMSLPSLEDYKQNKLTEFGLNDQNYQLNTATQQMEFVGTEKWITNLAEQFWEAHRDLDQNDVNNQAQMNEWVRTQRSERARSIIKAGNPSLSDRELDAKVADYMSVSDNSKDELLTSSLKTIETFLPLSGQQLVRNQQRKEVEASSARTKENNSAAYELLNSALSDTTVREHWWQSKALEGGKLEKLAKALGITTDALKAMPLEDVRKKFLDLGTELDRNEDAVSKFRKAQAAGVFDNKRYSGYMTASGDRIWESEDESNRVQRQSQVAYNTQAEAEAADIQGTVVRGPDDKWYIVTGGETESSLTSGYTGDADSTYAAEAAQTVADSEKDAVAAYQAKVSADLKVIDQAQIALRDGESIDWESITNQLDLTNPKIRECYMAFHDAAIAAQDAGLEGQKALDMVHASTDSLTSAVLQQGDATFENNDQMQAWLLSLKSANLVTTELGDALTYEDFMAIRAGKNINTAARALKALDKAMTKATKGTKLTAKTFRELRKEVGSDSKVFDKFIKNNKNLSKQEKELMIDTNNLMNKYEALGRSMGIPEDKLDDFVDGLMECENETQVFNKAIDSMTIEGWDKMQQKFGRGADGIKNMFDDWSNQLGEGLTSFKDSAQAMLEGTGVDVVDLMNACTDEIAKAGGDLTQVDWGKLANTMGVDVGTILQIMEEYLNVLAQANAIEGFDVSGLMSQLQAAIAETKKFQGKHGGGGGAHNDTPEKGSKGGGGGGNKKKYDNHKSFTDEIERYHEINQQLEKQQKLLTKLDKVKSMTYGKAHLKAMEDEIKALEKENELNQKKLNETKANLQANKAKLQKAFGNDILNPEDGTVNYAELKAQAIAEYNAAVDEYNTSKQEASDDLKFQKAQKRYEELMKLLEEYEEDLQQVEDTEANMLENQIKRSGLELEKIQYKIEVKLDLNDRDIKQLQYFRTKWEDTLNKQGDSFYGMITEAHKYEDNLATISEQIGILSTKYATGAITQADYATGLQDLNDKMLEQLENLTTIEKTIKEAYGNTLSMASENLQKFTSIIDHSREAMENYIAMQQLMGRGENFSELSKFYQTAFNSSVASAKALKDYNDQLKQSKDDIEAQITAAGGWEKASDVLKQQWEDVNNALQENENQLLSYTQQALEDAQKMFENTVQAAIKSFDAMLFGAKGSLKDMEDDYAYYTEQSERYLSTSKELYEVAKLNREINESIAGATTKASKERLKALQEEINKQSEKTQLTEYDVQMMELQYKYALALEDLEDKKNAKSIVRLTRDEAGNYGYQYTANEDEVNDAAQQVDDVLQQINELAANRVAEIEQAALTAEREYRDGLLEIAQDTTLTLDERMAKMQELTRRHEETMVYYQEQYGNATSALLTNQEFVYDRYGVSILENSHKIQDQMNADVKKMIDGTKDYAAELEKQMAPGGTIYEAMQKYKKDINLVQDTTGLSWASMTANTDEYAEANKKAKEAIKSVKDELDIALKDIKAATEQWDNHLNTLEALKQKYEELNSTIVKTLKSVSGSEVTIGMPADQESKSGQYQFSWAYKDLFGVASGFDTMEAAYDAAVTDMTGKFQQLVSAQDKDEDTAKQEAKVKAWVQEAKDKGKIKVVQYEFGGLADYTGPAWVDGSRSRPEMVLNPQDTHNLLTTIDLLHSIDTNMIKDLMETMRLSTVMMLSGLGNLNSNSVSAANSTIDQNVHIEAEFPNVTEKSEIVAAFDDLINLASQYANR